MRQKAQASAQPACVETQSVIFRRPSYGNDHALYTLYAAFKDRDELYRPVYTLEDLCKLGIAKTEPLLEPLPEASPERSVMESKLRAL